jgi:hypothetical protein
MTRQVTLARSLVNCRCHVCAFFRGAQERHEVLLPFIAEGLSLGDSAIQVIDRYDRPERMRLLVESGIDADAAEQSGQLTILNWEETYLSGGRFDQQAVLELADRIGAQRSPGTVTRVWAEMGWAAREPPGVRDLVEYESRLNRVLPKYDMAVVCAYDVDQFSSEVLTDVLRAHPYLIIGRTLTENPSYVPPDELLPELFRRKEM